MPTPEEQQQQKPSLLRRAASKVFSWNSYYTGMAIAATAVGVAAIATGAVVGAPNIAIAATTIAFEGYSLTPRYEKVANTKVGKVLTKGFRTVFNRTSLRVFRAAMIGVAIGMTGGTAAIAFGAVNAAGIGYNMYREVHELRKSRKLCRQEQNLKKLQKFSKVKEQVMEKEPELAKTLGITMSKESKKSLSPEPVADISRWLKVKLFAREMADNLAESAAGIVEALGSFAASPVAGIVTIAAMVGVGEGAKVEYRAKQRNKKLRAGLRAAGYHPKNKEDVQNLEASAVEEQATLMAFAEVKTLIEKGTLSRDNPEDLQKAFAGLKAVNASELKEQNAEKYKAQSAFKDLVSLHTSPYTDPMDATYEKHDAALERLDTQMQKMQADLGVKVTGVEAPSKGLEQVKAQDVAHGKGVEKEGVSADPPAAPSVASRPVPESAASVDPPAASSVASPTPIAKQELSTKEKSAGQKIVNAMKKIKHAVSSRMSRSGSGRGRGSGGMSI